MASIYDKGKAQKLIISKVKEYFKNYEPLNFGIDVDFSVLFEGPVNVVFTYVRNNVCYKGKECTFFVKCIVIVDDVGVIFTFNKEDTDLEVVMVEYYDIDIEVFDPTCYEDSFFMSDPNIVDLSVEELTKYYKSTRNNPDKAKKDFKDHVEKVFEDE